MALSPFSPLTEAEVVVRAGHAAEDVPRVVAAALNEIIAVNGFKLSLAEQKLLQKAQVLLTADIIKHGATRDGAAINRGADCFNYAGRLNELTIGVRDALIQNGAHPKTLDDTAIKRLLFIALLRQYDYWACKPSSLVERFAENLQWVRDLGFQAADWLTAIGVYAPLLSYKNTEKARLGFLYQSAALEICGLDIRPNCAAGPRLKGRTVSPLAAWSYRLLAADSNHLLALAGAELKTLRLSEIGQPQRARPEQRMLEAIGWSGNLAALPALEAEEQKKLDALKVQILQEMRDFGKAVVEARFRKGHRDPIRCVKRPTLLRTLTGGKDPTTLNADEKTLLVRQLIGLGIITAGERRSGLAAVRPLKTGRPVEV